VLRWRCCSTKRSSPAASAASATGWPSAREAWRLWGEAHRSVPLALALEAPAAGDAPARLQAAFATPASAAA
jgi:hypothetical protein